MKRLLLVHTGGTLGMSGARPMKPEALAQTLHGFIPELKAIAEIDFEVLFNIDSSDLQPEQIEELAATIREKIDRYDGLVVIHGTDTMVYTASALAFLFRGLAKPVVLTGSQRPIGEIRSDAKPNLIAACSIAALPDPIPEVSLLFGTELLRGCRAVKLHTAHFDAFASPNCPPLARLGVEIERGPGIRPPGSGLPSRLGRLSPQVFAFRLTPGLDPALLLRLLEGGVKGVVLEAFGMGNLPAHGRSLEPFLTRAARAGLPVIVSTQCVYGATDLTLYEGGRMALAQGAIPAGDMTTEAALMKLSLLAGEGAPLERVRAAFAEDWAGERSSEPAPRL